ncbi:MAG: hypothetical protein RM368_37190 [Nostoc sp. DedSLP03]|uniref:hypothetical protein n=1 Tax=Nostoc sp. DedSLP03 TaxID=3075400 RepID=UPI002AD479EB|nr:hypothetical protein [Nostoc sp. DedSLP03]MDZ7970502.1 hypothetical protein [Nostoc sp. DedSLP03]
MAHCQHLGCTEENVTACFYPDNETEQPNEYYCTVHAAKHGFCYMCGQFWGGVESFEFATIFGGSEGVCEICDYLASAELGEFDDDDDDCYWG